MLKGIPEILSPQLLKVLCEMGHSDRIVIADGNFPGRIHGKKMQLLYVVTDMAFRSFWNAIPYCYPP